MRRALTLGLPALAALGLATGVYVAMHPGNLLKDAEKSLARGDLRAAQLELDSYLKGHARHSRARFDLALVDLAEDNGVAAERNLRIARDGGYPPKAIIVPLGRAYLLQRHYDQALIDFTVANAPQGTRAQVLTVRALAYLGLHQLLEARRAASEAVQSDPDDTDAGIAAARVALAAQDIAAASAAITRALARQPRNAEARLLKADLALENDQAAAALTEIEAVLTSNPGRLDAKLARARALAALHRPQEAAQLVDEVCGAAPKAVDAQYLRAILAVQAQDYATADSALDTISAVIDELPLGNYLLGATKLGLNQPAQAEAAATQYAARHPNDPGAIKLLVLTRLATNQPVKALASLQPLLDADKPDAETLTLLARGQAMGGDVAGAARTLENAAALAPQNTDILNRLAAARLQLGETAAGEAALRQSLAAVPNQPAAAETLVRAALGAGDFAGATASVASLRQANADGALTGVLTGEIRAAQLDLAGARESYEAVLAKSPTNRAAVFDLVQLDSRTGQAQSARERLAAWMETHPADAEGLSLQVKAALARGDTAAAIAAAEAVHQADPASRAATETLARLYLGANQAQHAVALLERGAAANDTALLALRAEAQVRNGEPDQARRLYQQAIDANPGDPGPYLGLVALAEDARAYPEAKDAVRRGLAALPGNPRLLDAAVRVQLRAGGLQAALAEAAELRRDPANLPAALSLEGDLRATQGDQKGAADAYLAAFHTQPTADLALAAAAALAQSNREPQAMALLGDWLTRHPADAAAMEQLASMCISAHQVKAAAMWLDRVLALRPNDVVALNNSAWVKLSQGDTQAARALAQRAYYLSPGPDLQDTLGWVLARQGDTAGALALLQPAAAAKPSPGVLYHLAYTLHKAKRDGEARASLDRALNDKQRFDERGDAEALRRQVGL
jgi:putative PEP-CTERM system TPR-repeat lipoprotein